jgi:ABC-2 type transport system permease protein
VRDPLGVLLWLAIPLAVSALLELAFGAHGEPPRARLLVADEDESVGSRLFAGTLSQGRLAELLELEPVGSAEGRAAIEDGDASALLVIPAGFGDALLRSRPTRLELVRNPAERILPGIAEEVLSILVEGAFYAGRILREPLSRIVDTEGAEEGAAPDSALVSVTLAVNELVRRAGPWLFPPAIELVRTGADGDAAPARGFAEPFFPGMLFLSLLLVARALAGDVWAERAGGTLRRAATLPRRLEGLLAGKLLAGFLVLLAVAGVGLAAGRWAFGLPLANPVPALLWATFAGAAFLAAFQVLNLVAGSERGADVLTSAILFPLAFAGGSFFPLEIMPGWLARFGRATPNGWAVERFAAILRDEADAGALALGFAVLALATAAAFLIAARRLRTFAARS